MIHSSFRHRGQEADRTSSATSVLASALSARFRSSLAPAVLAWSWIAGFPAAATTNDLDTEPDAFFTE